LSSPNTKVILGNIRLTPQVVEKAKVKLELSGLDLQESDRLRAGVQSLQIVHSEKIISVIDPIKTIESNALPVILCPTILGSVDVTKLRESWNNLYSSEVTVEVDLTVDPNQRVSLLMSGVTNNNPEAYIFSAKSRKQKTEVLKFLVRDVKAGKYLIRVQIDGAESSLEIDPDPTSSTYQQYYKPMLTIDSEMLKNVMQPV
jgi:hypothetical protein